MKYQNYLHFKLPITMNPEDYGKVIEQNNNIYIIQLNTNNIVIIKQINEDNFVKFFRKGELIFEFKDSKLSEKRFIRTILDQRYTFRDGKLISTEIISTVTNILIYKSDEIHNDTDSVLTNPLYKDTGAIKLKPSSNEFGAIENYLENTYIFKNYKAELFILFELFGKNIHHYPTLPSLAFGIFRSNFMKENNIPQLSGKIAKDIRAGYTGGAVDMYIPKSKPGVKIKSYDVNSLYPSQMQSRLMPVGVPTYFNGDILKMDQNAFGFFYCKVIAPDDIKHPILQTHVKTNNGTRTISPLGT